MGTLLLLAIVGLTCSTVTGQQIKIFAGSPDRQDDLVSLNERVLFCRVTDLSGRVSDVRNAVFLLNGIDVLLNLTAGDYIVNPERGRIEFEITQRLEGRYTCGNGNIQSINHLDVVATPSPDTSIPRYYVRPVGTSVKMTCGILQGALGSLYDADWIFQGFRNVEQIYDDRAEVTREKLQDFSVEISALELTNSGSYICEVKVGQEGAETPVRSQEIVLLVYQDPKIDFLTSSQLHIIQPNDTRPPLIQFVCNATGSPDLQLEWSHNGNPIPSDSEDFSVTTVATHENGLTAAHSILRVREPELAHSGSITCSAEIEYRETNGDMVTTSRNIPRNLIVLDSSLEPRPYATQDGDLLVRMDLPAGVSIPGLTGIRLKTTPADSSKQPINFIIDDVFFEGSRFYAFVPASDLEFRQFWVQVALVVDGETGPFSPAEVSDRQYIDYDEAESCDSDDRVLHLALVIALPVTFVAVIIIVVPLAAWVCINNKNKNAQVRNKEQDCEANKVHDLVDLGKEKLKNKRDERRAHEVLLNVAKEQLEEERKRETPDLQKITEWEGYLKDIMDKALGRAVSAHPRETHSQAIPVVNGNAGGVIRSEGGIISDDGVHDSITRVEDPAVEAKNKIDSLIQQIDQVLAAKKAHKTTQV